MWIPVLLTFASVLAEKPAVVADVKNFHAGERATYRINYQLGISWSDAGEVTFGVDSAEYQGKTCFHFSGIGSTFSFYDWFFRVRDEYHAWVNPKTMKPYRFYRKVEEGGNHYNQEVIFNYAASTATVTTTRAGKSKTVKVKIGSETVDALTAIYRARQLPFEKIQAGNKQILSILLDEEVFQSDLLYEGKRKKDAAKNAETFYVFKPSLIEGSIFKGGSRMTVFSRMDAGKLPIYIETPILVGEVKVRLVKYNKGN